MDTDHDLTQVTSAASHGDAHAGEALFLALYNELRVTADKLLRREAAGHTLQPTALVHEAYRKLVDPARLTLNGRTHFRAVAARAMGQILIDHARAKKSQKRGGNRQRVALDDALSHGRTEEPADVNVLQLHRALEKMKHHDPQLAEIIMLRIFSGMSHSEIAGLLGTSVSRVEREWSMGRAWLRRELAKESGDE